MAAVLIIAVVGLAGALVGCAQRLDPPPSGKEAAQAPVADSPDAPLLGRFVGVLPCADCSGIRTELRLYSEQPSGHPTRYESTELSGDGRRRPHRSTNRALDDPAGIGDRSYATVYQLDFDRADVRRNFLRVGDAELRLLDRDEREITSTAPFSLYRVSKEQSVEPITIAERDSGRVVDVARGQTVVIRLSSNRSTGYRWTLAPASAGVLTALGEPVYTPASAPGSAVGRGGVEAWSFLANQRGQQELHFEYRRPWEPDAPVARVLDYTIAVR